jgi:hypothetical protein
MCAWARPVSPKARAMPWKNFMLLVVVVVGKRVEEKTRVFRSIPSRKDVKREEKFVGVILETRVLLW